MDTDNIFSNIKRMLEFRLNAHKIKFNIIFSEYDGDAGDTHEKLDMEISNSNEEYSVIYYKHKTRDIYKTVYLNLNVNKIKSLMDNDDVIILYSSNDRKIKKLLKTKHSCQFFISNLFLSDYRSNVYFTHVCKSSENLTLSSNLQYISADDFSVMYGGHREGDVILAVCLVDPTLIFPQLRIVKKDTIEGEDDDDDTNNKDIKDTINKELNK